MSDLIDTMRAIIRDEMVRMRPSELGIVMDVYANDADGNNHQVDVRLRGSGVELKRAPVTVQRYGMSALPRVGDLVLVIFLGGNLNAPMVIGCVYDENTQPPEAAPGELVYQIPDDGGERHLHVELPSGMSYTVDDEAISVTAGGTEVLLEKDGNVQIKAAGNIELKADGDVLLEAGGNLNLKAAIDVVIEGTNIESQANASAASKAPVLKFGGMTQFDPS